MNETVESKEARPEVELALSPDIARLTEHLFRHESAKLVSVLTGIFGISRLQLAEDVVQEALVRALKTWPYYGVPKNPAAWLTQTARNLALDVVRRERSFQEKQPKIIAFVEQWSAEGDVAEAAAFDNEIKHDRLRLMFACCHPSIPEESQIALSLKTLCGFGPGEIARAYLTTEAAIAKRITRAKQRIRDEQIPFEIPAGEELAARLDGVLQTLYLLFNEGYKASSGDQLIRRDICDEAIELTALLAGHPAGNVSKTHALLALMLLNAARFPARVDGEGNLLRLKDQDRSLWDRRRIVRGMAHLTRSAVGDTVTEYHLQAGIAACHCVAADYESTDWGQILSLYDRLTEVDASPVIALNRAIVVGNLDGPKAGLQALNAIPDREKLDAYHLYHAALGELEWQLKNLAAAAGHFRRALQLAATRSEQVFLRERFEACESPVAKTAGGK